DRAQAASGSCEVRNTESLPVSARRQTGGAPEQAPEERRILVADAPADLVDRGIGTLEAALGVFDSQALHIGDRRHAGRRTEAPLEGSLGELRTLDHFLDRV